MHSDFVIRLVRWATAPRHFWACMLGFVIALLVVFLPNSQSDGLRYAGLLLQLAGITTVLVSLEARRKLFERDSFLDAFGKWWQQRPRWKAKTVELHGSASLSMQGELSIAGDLEIWSADNPSLAPELRIAALSRNVEHLRKRLAALQNESTKRLSQLGDEFLSDRNKQEAAHQGLRSTLQRLGAGGIPFELMGLAWLFFGVVLATVPQEIAPLLGAVK